MKVKISSKKPIENHIENYTDTFYINIFKI